MLLRRLLPTAALATAAAAALTAIPAQPAAAEPIYEVDYRVDFELTAEWGVHRWEERGEHWKQNSDMDAKTRITGYLDHVLFRNGRLVTGTKMGIADQEATGTGHAETHTWSPIDDKWFVDRDDCEAGHENAVGSSRLQADPAGGLIFRATEDASIGYVCDTGNEDVHLGLPGRVMGAGTFDARFTLPNEAIGMGKIIQHISASDDQRSPGYCPGKEDPFVDICEFGWEGKLTFTRMAEEQYPGGPGGLHPDDDPDSVPEQPQQPSPPPGTDPRAEAIRKIFEEAAKAPKPIDPRAQAIIDAVAQYEAGDTSLKLRTSCPAGCSGTAGLLIGGARKPVATMRFRAKPGQKSVRLTLKPQARKALRRAKTAKLQVTLKPGGGGAPVKRTLRIKR